ncbi:ubiquitin-like small modifier protein 1 [Natronorubrum halophilum]|uniref:ubiquitin-like small modifier protein 1 n=1 Tax=Natronorubrum halophilum TaxID=1702106 RepID=UPI000EF640FB|nr:ubiquitin-like small modifier protein 1 [Natronorubrum halophilum]
MNVEIRLFAMYRDAIGEKRLALSVSDEATVREVLRTLEATYPELADRFLTAAGETKPAVTVLVNGQLVGNERGTATALEDGDALSIMPPVTGGECA